MPGPARSIAELEQRDASNKRRWRFGLTKLIVVSNILGIVVAVVVITKGMAVLVAITVGILVGFSLPMLVLIGIASVLLCEKLFGRKPRPIKTNARGSTKSPFND